jgi:hypothetical protein
MAENIGAPGLTLAPGLVHRAFEASGLAMQNIQETSLDIGQRMFNFFGLTTPFQRFMFGFTICETAIMLAKPGFAFTDKDEMKQFVLFARDKKNSTYVPWFLPGLAIGGILALFF